jgi:nucleoside-diphosphate-sugar epimerase
MGMMRILFIGGTGVTGPSAVRRFRELGHEVTLFHRGQHCQFEMPNPTPEVVIHTWLMTERDAEGFLLKFRGVVPRAVVISSGDVYRAYGRLKRLEPGPPDPIPLTEDAPLRASRYPYGGDYDKVVVEHMLQSQGDIQVTVLRYPAVWGPSDPNGRMQAWLAPEVQMEEGFADWRWTHGLAEDVAEAIVLAATKERATGRVYNVGEVVTPTMGERIAAWQCTAGWNGRVVTVPATHDYSHHLVMDTTRIREELGYKEW